MSTLKERLIERERSHGPYRIGLVGAGQMGTGLISQVEKMHGMKVVAVSDVMPTRAYDALVESSVDPGVISWENDDLDRANQLVLDGRRLATHSSEFLANIPALDAIVECTGIPNVGAIICNQAIEAGKQIINMNVETDATIGYYLTQKAKEKDVVYSLIAGDEPGSIKELYDFADALGFEIAMVGKGKNNPLDRAGNPTNLAERAKSKNMSPKMLASFVDGTKTMVEMTSIGNSIGFPPDVRGGHGPACDWRDLAKVFVPKNAGGIFSGKGFVDYAVGPAPGVFVIITTDQPKIIADLNYLGLTSGNNGFWVLYRPYHLANLESPITIANVLMDKRETINMMLEPVCESVAVAKKDLQTGDVIDALGGHTVYAIIEKAEIAREENLVPIGLSIGGVLTAPVKQGEPIRYDQILLREDDLIVKLRREQDRMVWG